MSKEKVVERKKVLVLGTGGQAGHMIYKYLDKQNRYEMGATFRKPVEGIHGICLDILDEFDTLANIIKTANPDVIVNCIGLLVKASEMNPSMAIYTNSFFPQGLAKITEDMKTKVIHLSTDCIFDGKIGKDEGYTEDMRPTETNWYGRTKALGEINNKKDLTLRCSIYGPELKDGTGLFNWFMKQTKCNGLSGQLWNGITTYELARQVARLIERDITGLYHLVPNVKISKYDLLVMTNEIFERGVEITEVPEPFANKTLINTREAEYDPQIPEYPTQILSLKKWMENGYEWYAKKS